MHGYTARTATERGDQIVDRVLAPYGGTAQQSERAQRFFSERAQNRSFVKYSARTADSPGGASEPRLAQFEASPLDPVKLGTCPTSGYATRVIYRGLDRFAMCRGGALTLPLANRGAVVGLDITRLDRRLPRPQPFKATTSDIVRPTGRTCQE